jgi:hypothetical protein
VIRTGAVVLTLLVILGAGASYDSLAKVPAPGQFVGSQWRPPLANQLFETRWGPYIQQFPQMHAIIPELERPDSDVEALLEKFQKESSEHPRRYNQLIAIRYYLQAMLENCLDNWENSTRGVTNYKALLDVIEHRVRGPKILVSFNYDTLLEEALGSTVGVRIRDLSDYVKSDYKIVKIHGSINWVHKVEAPQISVNMSPGLVSAEVIDRASALKINESFHLVQRHHIPVLDDKPTIPALSIPIASKSDYEAPSEQTRALVEYLPEVDRVVVIGWRGSEDKFSETLASVAVNNRPRFMVISRNRDSAADICEGINRSFSRRNVGATFSTVDGGFSYAILNHRIDEFLKETR